MCVLFIATKIIMKTLVYENLIVFKSQLNLIFLSKLKTLCRHSVQCLLQYYVFPMHLISNASTVTLLHGRPNNL